MEGLLLSVRNRILGATNPHSSGAVSMQDPLWRRCRDGGCGAPLGHGPSGGGWVGSMDVGV